MRARGFSLLEVVIALAILAISLTVLLETQIASITNAGRSRDLSIATMLARSKLIDIEQQLFHDGFKASTEEDGGNFSDIGYPEIAWKSRVIEVELNMQALSSLCGTFGARAEAKAQKLTGGDGPPGTGDCESMLSGFGSILGSFTDEMARSMRLLDLNLTWPEGKHSGHLQIHSLLTRDDFGTQQENDLNRLNSQINNGQVNPANPLQGLPGAGNQAAQH